MQAKKVSEKNIVMKVKKGFEENIAVKTEKMNKTAKPLSPDLLLKMNTYWRAQFPHLQPGRNRVESLGRRVRGDEPLLDRSNHVSV